jgi:hypothetical protein
METPSFFTCEICRKSPLAGDWARKWKWRTAKGLKGHRCYADEQRRAKESAEAAVLIDRQWKEWLDLGLTDRKVGDEVICSAYLVSSPTHQGEGSFRRKVRYEEGRSYFARIGEVTGILGPNMNAAEVVANALRHREPIADIDYEIDHGIMSVAFHETMAEAEADAGLRQAGYDEHLKESELLR